MHIEPLEPRLQCTATPLASFHPGLFEQASHSADAPATQFAASRPAVHFADPTVEMIVREMLHRPTGKITRKSMLALKHFEHDGFGARPDDNFQGIRSLEGLQYARNLRYLNVNRNLVSDLAPLARLSELRTIRLIDNRVTDVRPILRLGKLRALALGRNPIRLGLAGVGDLPELIALDCSECGIKSIEFIGRLPNLRHLGLDQNEITNISPLAGLTQLRHLELSHNPVTDLTPLAGLRHVTFLFLINNRFSDISPLAAVGRRGTATDLAENELDLSAGSPASQVIAQLKARGLFVFV
jgi:internalin A